MSSRPSYTPPPAAAPPIYLHIDRAMRANNLLRAVELAQQALDAGYRDPALFSLRARWRKHRGMAADAIADLETALALDPRSATILTEIADCLNGLGHHKKACEAAAEAISYDPMLAQAWYQKALAHQMLNELEKAQSGYREAVRRDPELADALARLAAMAVEQSEHAAARDYADRALAVLPGHDVALLAHITLDLAQEQLDQADNRIHLLLANPRTPPLTRAIALSHLGDLHDRRAKRKDAFAAYREAGSVWKAVYGERFERPGIETVPQLFERLNKAVASMPPLRATTPRPHAEHAAGLAFVLGFPRSGTTLLGQVLASRPNVALFEEKPLLTRAITDFINAPNGFARLTDASDAQLEPYRQDFWQRARQCGIETRGRLMVEQTAFNTTYLPVIKRLFPQAAIVLALRDPRDVVFSCFRRLFGPNPYTLPFHALDSTARLYDAAMRYAQTCRDRLDLRPLEIRNEDLIADFDGVTRRLCDHLGLDWDESMRDYQKVSGPRLLSTRSAAQVRRGLSGAGVAQWRHYREELEPVLALLAPWVEQFGYERD